MGVAPENNSTTPLRKVQAARNRGRIMLLHRATSLDIDSMVVPLETFSLIAKRIIAVANGNRK